MSRTVRATAIVGLPLVVALASLAPACTGSDDDSASTADGSAPATVGPTTTSARDTPFCAGMIDLAERVEEADDDDDVTEMIRSTYADLTDVVPPAIEADFQAVRQLLVDRTDGAGPTTSGPASTVDVSDATAADGDGEGAALATTPTERLADYIELVCRSTANNPGPPETEPS